MNALQRDLKRLVPMVEAAGVLCNSFHIGF